LLGMLVIGLVALACEDDSTNESSGYGSGDYSGSGAVASSYAPARTSSLESTITSLSQLKSEAESSLRTLKADSRRGLISARGLGAAVQDYETARGSFAAWITAAQASLTTGNPVSRATEDDANSKATTFLKRASSTHGAVTGGRPDTDYCPDQVAYRSASVMGTTVAMLRQLPSSIGSERIAPRRSRVEASLPCAAIVSFVGEMLLNVVSAAREEARQIEAQKRAELSSLLEKQKWAPSSLVF
jgi:hypothetical protein